MRAQRGVALLVVLWIAILLTLGVYTALLAATLQNSLSENHGAELIARQAALSAIAAAIAILDEDKDDNIFDGLGDSWADADENDTYEVELGDGQTPLAYYTLIRVASTAGESDEPEYGIGDEASRVNINVASEEILTQLPGMTTEIAQAILDWRDPDDEAMETGAESSHYMTLSPPYAARNGPFETLHELLFVRDVTEELFYGEDTNLNGILDPNEDDGDRTFPDDNSDGELDRGLFHWCTVWSYDLNKTADGEDRVNLNVDSFQTIRTALGDVLTTAELNQIEQRRSRQPFRSIGQLLEIRDRFGRPERTISREDLMKIADKITIYDEERVPGLINILTAPKEVLSGLPGMNEERADAIMQWREGEGLEVQSIADILKIGNQIPDQTFTALAALITVRSHQFRIDAVGRAADRPVFRRYWAIYDRAPEEPRVIYLKEISSHGFPYVLDEEAAP